MATCGVRWRPSGGRGEYEFVPAGSLEGRSISIEVDAAGVVIPAEVRGEHAQGKPRLRKFEANNRTKLHLPALVTAIARLPEPRREDITHKVSFPLENKGYVLDEMTFDIVEDDDETVILRPLRMTIQNSEMVIDLQDRLALIARDFANADDIGRTNLPLAAAVRKHFELVQTGINSREIRQAADEALRLQADTFGPSNFGSITVLAEATANSGLEIEADIYGIEGRTLTRVHIYKERDRLLVKKAKRHYKNLWGKLRCQSCGLEPDTIYGARGDSCIEAHHLVPIEELLPDSVTTIADLAMVCASCHRIVHSVKPCLPLEQVKTS